MKTIKTLLLCYLLIPVTLVSCGQSQKAGQINAEEFKSKLQQTQNAQLIDVRTPEEFKDGHLAGAVNVNFYDADFNEKIKTLDKSKPVFVYCSAGGRSASAAGMMKEQGFKEVHDLAGGSDEWKKKGNEVVK